MKRQSASKKMTRTEILVVVGLTLFVLGIVSPLFSRSREHHERILCSANLAHIGAAMLVYTQDYDGALPRAGGPSSGWGAPIDWMAPDRETAFGIGLPETPGGFATISSAFYLLVKYMEVPTGVFVCAGDTLTSPWRLADEPEAPPGLELADAWDFGAEPTTHCSYTCHLPYDSYALTTSREPNLPVAADRNPWIESPGGQPAYFGEFMPDCSPYGGTAEQARTGNSPSHQKDGQNVLLLDGRVVFETRAYCGIGDDNTYTSSMSVSEGDPFGIDPHWEIWPQPMNADDSLLVHDPNEAFLPPKPR